MRCRIQRSCLLVLVAAWLAGCSEPPSAPSATELATTAPPDPTPSLLPAEVEPCGEVTEVALVAGQSEIVGTVTVANDQDHLYVTYELEPGWTLASTHLEAASSLDDVPTNGPGNPVVGHFAHSETHSNVGAFTYEIRLDALPVAHGEEVFIAAHADVHDPAADRSEGAWAAGSRFPGASTWATYLSSRIQDCTPTRICTGDDPAAVVTFPDPNLEVHVRIALGQNPQSSLALTCGQVTTLRYLDARSSFFVDRVEDLSGIENLTDLNTLLLTRNAIADVGPLRGLTELQRLQLDDNEVTDVTPLETLTKLRALDLSDNSVSDVSPLGALNNLTLLGLRGNRIADIAPLSSLVALESLFLTDNPVEDFGPLGSLGRLQFLSVSNTGLSDLQPLSDLDALTGLRANSNSISDLGPLSGMTGLEGLSLHDNAISDLAPLSALTEMSDLGLGGNAIVDIGALESLPELEIVQLFENQDLQDIGPLLRNAGVGETDGDSSRDHVNLVSTAVSCTDIRALSDQGVRVLSNCP